MSVQDTKPILARIIAAHQGAGAGQASLKAGLQMGLSRALRRAALPFPKLLAQVADVSVQSYTSLDAAIDALPEHGILAAIEDEDGRRGLVALDHPLVDALIEVQTTGHVEDADLPPRVVTRIDEALCRDFLDLVFASFSQETLKTAGRDWPDRMTYGSIVVDKGQLNLLLPEQGYHLMTTSVTAAGRKTGGVVLLIPCDPVLARRNAAKAEPGVKPAPVDWSHDMLAAVGAAPIVLDAVLMRVTMPLGQVEALQVGDLVPFDHADLTRVQLEGEGGHVFAKGSLGQQSGKRAFRLSVDGAPNPPTQASSGAVPPPQTQPAAMPPMQPPASAAPPAVPNMAGFDPNAPMEAFNPDAPMGAGLDPSTPMGGFDPDAPMAGFDPDAPMGGLDPNAPMGGFDPDAPMGDFDPNAPMG